MKIGLQVPSFTWPEGAAGIRSKLSEIARAAEEAGFDSLWVMDHFFQIRGVGPAEAEMLESYSTLAYLAGVTERITLGALVTGVIYRHPGLLVKTVTTLDVLSGGRAYFGLGAGWFEREALGLGVPFPTLKERFERLEETLQITRQMWSAENGAYEGKHFHLAETMCNPQPITQAAPADPDRGHGRTQDASVGGAVRGRVQPVRPHRDRHAEIQVGRAETAL